MKRLILKWIRFYQKRTPFFLSWHLSCRFQPTCSEYTYQAIKSYGIMRGSWLGLKRICKCHPWHQGGLDPLPLK
ncbi:MAG: membrane protein insertion efficiency factor YidD [Candidatus Shapirobacteria bacterium]|nr:membrane protein insertion efficiency factor YidD [Candidatus Shapirobacteria bacterium]